MPFDDTIPYVCNVDYGMDTTLWKCTAKASLVAAGGSLATGCSTANWLRATGGDDTCVNCDTTGEYWDYFSKKCVASASADSGDTTTSGFSKVVYTTASVILVAVLSIFA